LPDDWAIRKAPAGHTSQIHGSLLIRQGRRAA
jgi:hypothetical protein